jgi:hypothetical protein
MKKTPKFVNFQRKCLRYKALACDLVRTHIFTEQHARALSYFVILWYSTLCDRLGYLISMYQHYKASQVRKRSIPFHCLRQD